MNADAAAIQLQRRAAEGRVANLDVSVPTAQTATRSFVKHWAVSPNSELCIQRCGRPASTVLFKGVSYQPTGSLGDEQSSYLTRSAVTFPAVKLDPSAANIKSGMPPDEKNVFAECGYRATSPKMAAVSTR